MVRVFVLMKLIAKGRVLEEVGEIVPKIEGAPDRENIRMPGVAGIRLRPLAQRKTLRVAAVGSGRGSRIGLCLGPRARESDPSSPMVVIGHSGHGTFNALPSE